MIQEGIRFFLNSNHGFRNRGCRFLRVIPLETHGDSFKIDLTPRFFSYEIGRKGLILGADEVPCLIQRFPRALQVKADAVILALEVIPPSPYIQMFGDFLVEGFNYMSYSVSVLFFFLQTCHKFIESVKFLCFACDTVSAVTIVCHVRV